MRPVSLFFLKVCIYIYIYIYIKMLCWYLFLEFWSEIFIISSIYLIGEELLGLIYLTRKEIMSKNKYFLCKMHFYHQAIDLLLCHSPHENGPYISCCISVWVNTKKIKAIIECCQNCRRGMLRVKRKKLSVIFQVKIGNGIFY